MSGLGSRFLVVGVLGLSTAVAAAGEVQLVTIDFEGFRKGDIVSQLPHPGSDLSIRVHGANPGFERNAAVIFDSAEPGPRDRDLGSPNDSFEIVGADGVSVPGPGRGDGGVEGAACQNARPLGKILIVDDDLAPLTEDGRVQEPDDEGRIDAHLFLDFSELGTVTIHGMAVIDVEEPDALIWFYDTVHGPKARSRPAHRHILAHYRVHTEDNGVARLFDPELRNVPEEGCHVTLVRRKRGKPLEPVTGVKSMEIAFSGSGAVARIIYSADERAGARPKP